MTDTATELVTAEPELVLPLPRTFTMVRSYPTELQAVDGDEDGRTVFGRMFPIGETAHVRELVDGKVIEYEEHFLPGCTTRIQQSGQAHRILLRIDHGEDFDGKVGFCRALEERDDGAYGTFRLYEGTQLPKVRSMLTESHTGMSVQFIDVAKPRVSGRSVGRVQIHIQHVAATPAPVYSSAGILQMRSGDDGAGTPNLDRVRQMLADLDGAP